MLCQDELILPEALLLLSLDDATGADRHGFLASVLGNGITLAALFELYLCGRLRFVPEPETTILAEEGPEVLRERFTSHAIPFGSESLLWQLTDFTSVGHPLLDALLASLERVPSIQIQTRRTLEDYADLAWVYYESAENDLRDLAAHRLIANGTLTVGERRWLGVFRERLLPEERNTEEQAVIARLRHVILDNQPAEERDIALLILVRACGLIRTVFARDDEQAEVDWRITKLIGFVRAPRTPVAALMNCFMSSPD